MVKDNDEKMLTIQQRRFYLEQFWKAVEMYEPKLEIPEVKDGGFFMRGYSPEVPISGPIGSFLLNAHSTYQATKAGMEKWFRESEKKDTHFIVGWQVFPLYIDNDKNLFSDNIYMAVQALLIESKPKLTPRPVTTNG